VNVPAPTPPSPRSRWRHARRVAWATAAMVVFTVVLLAWLLNTIAGRDFLLARIVAALPADAHLSWTSAEGPVAGPMTLHGVRFAWHGHEFRAAPVPLDPALEPVVWRKAAADRWQGADPRVVVAAPQGEDVEIPGPHPREEGCLLTISGALELRNTEAAPTIAIVKHHEAAGVLERETLEQHPLHDAEHRRVGADAQGQNRHGRERE